MEKAGVFQDRLSDFDRDFLSDRDTFYWASTSATGWPYVQHRGGPKGFVKVIDDQTLAFADFRGNKQYISAGNLLSDDRVAMIMVDYPRQARLKILGHVESPEAEEGEPWLDRVREPGSTSVIERVFVVHIAAYDWNCPQHITPRYTAEEIQQSVRSLEQRMRVLEQENQDLRNRLEHCQTK